MTEQWNDDSDFLDDEDEEQLEDDEDDEVEDEPEPSPPPTRASGRNPRRERSSAPPERDKPKRHLRVKPMSSSMRQKWPDVTSCLLTLSTGKQVMFVRS